MRKLLLLLFVAALAYTKVSAQRMTIPTVGKGSMPTNMYAPNQVGNTVNEVDLQSQYAQGQWTRGNVKFKNGQEAKNMLLLFDVHANKLYFLQDKTTMEFVYPVYEFEIGLLLNQDTVMVHYRSSYPAINNNNDETFYEIVVDGSKMQLLWCRAKTIQMYKDGSEPEHRRNTEKDQWFVYLPEGKMVKIKKDKNDIMKALPEYAEQINLIVREKSLRLKEPDHLIELFARLNGL